MTRAMFFDVDGTLIDSRADLANAVNATRRDLGLAPLRLEDVMACVGNGARYLLEHAIPEASGSFDEVWPLHRRNYEANMMRETRLYPGVKETLAELAERGVRLGVVTNKPNWATRLILEHLGILGFFGEAVAAGGDTPAMKPAPEPLFFCARVLGVASLSPDDMMVGDNWTDLACGSRAGVSSIFCTYGFGRAKDEKITASIASIPELLKLAIP